MIAFVDLLLPLFLALVTRAESATQTWRGSRREQLPPERDGRAGAIWSATLALRPPCLRPRVPVCACQWPANVRSEHARRAPAQNRARTIHAAAHTRRYRNCGVQARLRADRWARGAQDHQALARRGQPQRDGVGPAARHGHHPKRHDDTRGRRERRPWRAPAPGEGRGGVALAHEAAGRPTLGRRVQAAQGWGVLRPGVR